LPENDLKDAKYLITPNAPQKIRLISVGSLIQYYRDNEKLFELKDPEPYTSGWFGFRTVTNHMVIKHFLIYRLYPLETRKPQPPLKPPIAKPPS